MKKQTMHSAETTSNELGEGKAGCAPRLWLAFSLTLVLLLVILAVPYFRQYRTLQWVRAQDGIVQTDSTWLTARLPNAVSDWLSENGWLESVEEVKVVNLGRTQVTDASLKHLKGLPALQGLNLHQTQVGDAGLERLKGITSLQNLSLHGTLVTDDGLEHLKGLTDLRVLFLHDTRVTDSGLEHLKGITSLQQLTLFRTQVTQAGVKDLKTANPSLLVATRSLRSQGGRSLRTQGVAP